MQSLAMTWKAISIATNSAANYGLIPVDEDTKAVIRSRKSTEKQYNDQNRKRQIDNTRSTKQYYITHKSAWINTGVPEGI